MSKSSDKPKKQQKQKTLNERMQREARGEEGRLKILYPGSQVRTGRELGG